MYYGLLGSVEDSVLRRLQGLKERYERHHQCIYDFGALEAAVALSSRYVADRFLPDKVRAGAGFECS